MSSTSITDRRFAALTLVAVAVLFAIAGVFAVGGVAYQQFFPFVSTLKWREGNSFAFWQGDILYAESRIDPVTGPTGPVRIKGLNPATGVVRDLGIETPGSVASIFSNGERLWVVSLGEVIESDGVNVVHHHPRLALTQTSVPFLSDGRLTVLLPDDDGNSFLFTFVDGEWQRGRQVALLGTGRQWEQDAERGEMRLVPRTAKDGVSTIGGWEMTRVVQVGDDHHIVTSTFGAGAHGTAYRRGFDFVPEAVETPSALAPANSIADTAGWHLLDQKSFNFQAVPVNVRDEFRLAMPVTTWLWRPASSETGQFEAVVQAARYPVNSLGVVSSPDGKDVYIVFTSRYLDLNVFRLDENQAVEMPHHVAGIAEPVVRYIQRAVLQGLGVILLSHLLLLGGAMWLAARGHNAAYSFGHQMAVTAPLGRRWLARGIDLSLILGPPLAVALHALSNIPAEHWLENQMEIYQAITSGFSNGTFRGREQEVFDYLVCSVAWGAVVFIATVIVQGRCGATLGKWLCGLRVFRTTLRPCGFARSLLREVLLWVDIPFLLTPIPGVTTILLTENRRRVGDLVADTLVIDVRSHRSEIAAVEDARVGD